jgi:hypothetical protein
MTETAESTWRRRAAVLQLRINFGWWLSRFLPGLLVYALVFACLVLVARGLGWQPKPLWFVPGTVVLAGVSAGRARRRWFNGDDALAYMDAHWSLKNRLVSARAGVGDWPDAEPPGAPLLVWRMRSLAKPLAGAAAVVAAAFWVPIRPAASEAGPYVVQEPYAWTQVASWMEILQEQEFLRSEDLQAVMDKLAHLRDQPAEEWYSHHSLEAGDTLREQTELSLRALRRDLDLAFNALATARDFSDELSAAALDALSMDLQRALNGLQEGPFKLSNELLEQLRSLDLNKLKNLSPAMCEALMKALQEGSQSCGACVGLTEAAVAELAVAAGAGRGGIDRGPGTAPITLAPDATAMSPTRLETVSNPDVRRAALGDLVSVESGEHRVDPDSYGGLSAGGTVEQAGHGGEAVWKSTWLPEERRVLQRYFQ